MSNDRRRHVRYKITLPVEIRSQGQSWGIKGETSDISTSGFYHSTMMQMQVGTAIAVTIWYAEQSLRCSAVVRTSDPGVGNGIEFVNLAPAAEKALAEFLSSLPE